MVEYLCNKVCIYAPMNSEFCNVVPPWLIASCNLLAIILPVTQVLEPLRGDTLLVGQVQSSPSPQPSKAAEERRSRQQDLAVQLMNSLAQTALGAGLPAPRVVPMRSDGAADLLAATTGWGVQVLGCVVGPWKDVLWQKRHRDALGNFTQEGGAADVAGVAGAAPTLPSTDGTAAQPDGMPTSLAFAFCRCQAASTRRCPTTWCTSSTRARAPSLSIGMPRSFDVTGQLQRPQNESFRHRQGTVLRLRASYGCWL